MKIAGNTTVYRTDELSSIIHHVYRALKKELTPKQLQKIRWKQLRLTIRQRPRSGVSSINLTSINIPKRASLSEFVFAHAASAMLCYRAGLSRNRIWTEANYLKKFSTTVRIHRKDETIPIKPKPVIDSPVPIQNLSSREFAARMRAKRNAEKENNTSGAR